MAASIQSPADVLNVALRQIGYRMRVGSLFDGSEAASQALDIYAQTRDAVLRSANWSFAEKIAAGVLTAPQTPPQPWLFEYTYPTDCMRLRNVFNATYLADQNNPLPVRYTVAGPDNAKVVWTRVAGPTFVYTRQVTDPTRWEPLFVETLATQLGERLAAVLNIKEGTKMEMERAKLIGSLAESIQG